MILRLEKDGFKVLSINARDVSDQYVLKVDGRDFYLFSLEMAVDNGFYCTRHIYNPEKKRFDCIDLPVQFLHLKNYGNEFLLSRELQYRETLSEGLSARKTFDLIFTVREEFGIPSDAEFQVCL